MPSLYFANPAGFFALSILPVILAIHLLQRRNRVVEISTLFLLEPALRESVGGRRIERLRQSIPLWLQLLAATLLALCLAGPRLIRPTSIQQVVIVLDSSASMQAFRAETLATLERLARQLASSAARTEWLLLESDRSRPTLFNGTEIVALLAAAEGWQPTSGAVDPTETFRSLAGGKSALHLYLTDHPATFADGIHVVSVGRVLQNVGIAGMRVATSDNQWEVLVKNYGTQPQTRSWQIDQAPPTTLRLEPGQTITLQGTFTQEKIILSLSPDAFALDDRLPLVRPKARPLHLSIRSEKKFLPPLADSLAGVVRFTNLDTATLLITADRGTPSLPALGGAFLFQEEPVAPEKFLPGTVVATGHPLVQDLNWQGLLIRVSDISPPTLAEGEETLLWAGDFPLVTLEMRGRLPVLRLRFDPTHSNLDRLPAFVLLFHRFASLVREQSRVATTDNFELGQPLPTGPTQGALLLAAEGEAALEIAPEAAAFARAPRLPAFFTLSEKTGRLLVSGASGFADNREADFQQASPVDDTANLLQTLRTQNAGTDLLFPLLLLCAGVALGAYWTWPWRVKK